MRSRLPLGVLLVAVLLASCDGRPGVAVSIGGERVPMVLASTTEGTACSTSHGDAFPQLAPLPTVRAATPVALHFEADPGATQTPGRSHALAAQSHPRAP